MTKQTSSNSAFTLVEMAIVLVVIGLIVGAILVGQTLIRSAEIQRVVTEFSRFTAAANTFRERYRALPGDFLDAESYWGSDVGCPGTAFNTNPKMATCNGNGDGSIGIHQSSSDCREMWRAWQQLADAGLIAGVFSGVGIGDGSGTGCLIQPGVTTPKSNLANATWVILTYNSTVASIWPSSYFPGHYSNGFALGNFTNNQIIPVMTPQEAYLIDTKLDDGAAATGAIVSPMPDYTPNCVTSADPTTAQYILTSSSIGCALFFRNAF